MLQGSLSDSSRHLANWGLVMRWEGGQGDQGGGLGRRLQVADIHLLICYLLYLS